jgi:hypothetical protein
MWGAPAKARLEFLVYSKTRGSASREVRVAPARRTQSFR